jgi:hypothetical protein
MMSAVDALKAAALGLLRAREHHQAAEILAAGALELAGPDELWAVGSRTVNATAVVLLVDPEPFVRTRADQALFEELRAALGDAMASERTALKELVLCLRLPIIDQPWRHVYREAPHTSEPRSPEPGAVLAAAASVLQAQGELADAELLARCTLELGEIRAEHAHGATLLLHGVLRVPPIELAELHRQRERADRLRQALIDAATGPLIAVGEVTLGALVK